MDADESLQEAGDETFIWEDPRERPRDGATVIRERAGRLDLETFAPLVAQHTGLHRAEAAKICQAGHGVLVDNIDVSAAEALAAALHAHGEPCFVIPAAFLIPLPRAKAIHGLRLLKRELQLVDAAGHVQTVPWDKLLLLAAAHVPVERTVQRSAPDNLFTRRVSYGAVALGGAAGAAIAAAGSAVTSGPRARQSSALHTLANIVALHPLRRFEFDGRELDYSVLGEQVQPSSEANARLILRWLLTVAPHLRCNLEADQMRAGIEAPLPVHTRHDLDATVHWMINLARFGTGAAAGGEGPQESAPE